MAKLYAALILVFVIEVALVTFGGTDYPQSSLYGFLSAPEAFSSTGFYIAMFAILVSAGVAYIVPGSFVQINQWALYAAFGAIAITFGVHISHLYSFLNGQLTSIMDPGVVCGTLSKCTGSWIAMLITAPLILWYLITIVEWGRNN